MGSFAGPARRVIPSCPEQPMFIDQKTVQGSDAVHSATMQLTKLFLETVKPIWITYATLGIVNRDGNGMHSTISINRETTDQLRADNKDGTD